MNINSTSVSTSALNQATSRVDKANEQLVSGSRINSAADDAAGLAITTSLSSETQGQMQAIENAGSGISLTQTASGALDSVINNLQRIRELSVQAANGTLTDSDRAAIDAEAQSLIEDTSSILESSEFNGVSLFNGSEDQVFQVGADAGDTLTAESNDLAQQAQDLGLGDIDLSTAEGASQAISTSDELLGAVSETASEFGALASQFESTISSLEGSVLSGIEATSQIQDADFAEVISERSAAQIQEQVSIAVQVQANERRGGVLQLLGTS